MINRVAVLGCGPAGLLAAHAAVSQGRQVSIYSVKKKSPIGGAQYLHFHIPGVSSPEPEGRVTYRQHGTREGYAVKVYGDPDAPVSWDNYPPGVYDIWPMQQVYDRLWDRYQDLIFHQGLDHEDIPKFMNSNDLVIMAVPRNNFCMNDNHEFVRQSVWIDYRNTQRPALNRIIYSGDGSNDWYRHSMLFGWESYEYAYEPQTAKHGDLIRVDKPLRTNCDCWDHPDLMRVGRYGKWEKSALAHEAFFEVTHRLVREYQSWDYQP